jgi:hypothetical protein
MFYRIALITELEGGLERTPSEAPESGERKFEEK